MNWLLKLFFSFRLRGRALLKKALAGPDAVPGPLCLSRDKVRLPFINGLNLPWLSYGGDFGANGWKPLGGVGKGANREAMQRIFRKLHDRGIRTIRWFLLCDGRAGIRFTRAGTPLGPDQHLFVDMDAALEVAAACELSIIFVLLDFLWFGKAALVNGVQVRGRAGVISGAYKQRALRRRVLKPLFKRYGHSPVILAWDIVNEPEWVTLGFGDSSDTAVPYLTMRRFITKTARLVQRHTRQLATVGLANTAGLTLVRDSGLDFYQVHWYDRWDAQSPLDKPVPEWNLDRPLLLGEYPTKNSARSPDAIIASAKNSGYCGALAWSFLGSDHVSGINRPGEET
ncbi:MAG: hypothetical protein JXI33_01090 [Candidatus Aminicenantes bacterium]|nr:hypothetical protein [Candidatus Aminicenantes bacterium]